MRLLLLLLFLAGVFCTSKGQSQEKIDSLKSELRKEITSSDSVMVYSELSDIFSYLDLDSSIIYGKICVEVARRTDSTTYGFALGGLSIPYFYKGDIDKALALNFLGIKLVKNADTSKELYSYYSRIGYGYMSKGDNTKAVEYMILAANDAERLQDTSDLILIYDQIGLALRQSKNYGKSKIYHEKAYKLAIHTGDPYLINHTATNLGVIHFELKEWRTAVSLLLKSTAYFEEQGMDRVLGVTYLNLGASYELLEIPDSALYFDLLAYRNLKEQQQVEQLVIICANLGMLYSKEGNLTDARFYLLEGSALADSSDYLFGEEMIETGWVEYYKSGGDFEASLKHFEKLTTIKDSLYKIESVEQVEEMETKYETEKKEKLLARNEVEIANQKLEVKSRDNWLMTLSAGALLLILTGVFTYRQQRLRNEKLREEARLKEELSKAEIKSSIQEDRVRISKDLHDHIGAQLTVISSSLDNLAFAEKDEKRKDSFDQISDYTRDTMAQLRETIWAMNKEAVTIEMLAAKLREFTGALNGDSEKIVIELKCKEPIVLGPLQAIAIYRVCQEAINNALKHGQFNKMTVLIDKEEADLRVAITDDGVGFELDTVSKHGYGLANMKQRMEEVGGSCRIQSSPGRGTQIQLTKTLNKANYV